VGAQGVAACINVLHLIPTLATKPFTVKAFLALAAVDLTKALSPTTIAALEAYRDKCIQDCGLSGDESAPEYQSMLRGLAVDAPILRFGRTELGDATLGICAALERERWGRMLEAYNNCEF
jgi:hypothetical protein